MSISGHLLLLGQGGGGAAESVYGGALCAVCALCVRCTKSRLFVNTGSHGSQGPEFCTLQPLLVHHCWYACHGSHAVLNGSCTLL